MARTEAARYSFNRGLISPLALGRVDLKRSALAAEEQTNWIPRSLGSMMLRCGLRYLGNTANNLPAQYIEFVRSLTAMHLLEFTNAAMRVWTGDALLTRVAVSSAVAGGAFPSAADLAANWTDSDEAGAVSSWSAAGDVRFVGTGTAAAIRDQQVAVAAPDQNKEHALRIVITRGPITLRVGNALGDDSYINETTLFTGTHSLAFTPTGASFFIRLLSRLTRQAIIQSVNVEAAGVVSIPSPYLTADLDNIRADTDSLSVDVLFVACVGFQQRRIERRANGRSWSIVLYQPDDGPFRTVNVSTLTLQPSVISGNGTLTASRPFFKSTHAPSANNGGALFAVTSTGQIVNKSMTAVNDATNSIRVIGITTDRSFLIVLSGLTGTGNTVILQRSFDNAIWTPVAGKTWAADTTESFADGLDNQIIFYRLIMTVHAAGTTLSQLNIATGSIRGIARVTGFTSNLIVSIEVLTDFGGLASSDDWEEGLWSDFRGWPSAGALYEGRLAWGGFDSIVLSISDAFDAFDAFDPVNQGDSGPINRSIGSGPMDVINWILPLQRLLLGAQLAEHSVRSNAFDEPLTPTNFNRKQASTQGSSNVQAIRIGPRGVYVQRGGTRVFELSFDNQTFDYQSSDMTILNPEVCLPMVKRMAVQRQPDTRIHCVLSDGTAAVQVYDHAEEVNCWIKITTDGVIEDVVVLPGGNGTFEDQVYYSVARTINSATVRFLEKWAIESECQGGTLNKQADAHLVIAQAASATVAGLTHLIGESVIAWADGKCMRDANGDIALFVVSGAGTISLTDLGVAYLATNVVVGLPYTARFKSAKLGQTLSKQKNIDHFAAILHNTHAQGLEYGQDFDNMDNLPLMYHGSPVDPNSVYPEYDEQTQEFPGTWDSDARLCLRASAPRACTVLAAVIEGQVTA